MVGLWEVVVSVVISDQQNFTKLNRLDRFNLRDLGANEFFNTVFKGHLGHRAAFARSGELHFNYTVVGNIY